MSEAMYSNPGWYPRKAGEIECHTKNFASGGKRREELKKELVDLLLYSSFILPKIIAAH